MPKELSKETVDRISQEARKYAATLVDEIDGTPQFICYQRGAQSEALSSLNEIEKLKKEIDRINNLWKMDLELFKEQRALRQALEEDREERIAHQMNLEDKNKQLIEMLNKWLSFDSRFDNASKIAALHLATVSLLESLPNKEA